MKRDSRLYLIFAATLSAVAVNGCADTPATPVAAGVLSVAMADESAFYHLRTEDDLLVRLDLSGMPGAESQDFAWLRAGGTEVVVFGTVNPDGSIFVERLEAMDPSEGVGRAESALVTTGTKRALVFQITFDGGSPLASIADINRAFTDFSSYLRAASFGAVNFEYDVVGPYNIAFGSCDNNGTWVNDAKAIARSNGIDLSRYTHFALAVRVDCGYGGMGEQPGSITWLANLDRGLLTHEFGHNFGLWHAGARHCTESGATVSMGGSCTIEEYGHPFDAMGHAYERHDYNAQYKVNLGWIPSSQVVTATSDQTVTLVPENQAVSGIKLLRINGADGWTYAVDFRQSTSWDSYNANDSVVRGVLVQAFGPAGSWDAERAQLLDMLPGTSSFYDGALTAGRSWRIPGTNTAINVVSVSSTGAQVRVSGIGNSAPARAFRHQYSGKCLSIEGASTANGANTVQRTCDGGADQLWRTTALADGTYTVVNVASGRCLDVYGGGTANGTRVIQWDCHGGSNQAWRMLSNPNGTTTFESVSAAGQCLDDYEWSTAENAPLLLWSCSGQAVQQFVAQ